MGIEQVLESSGRRAEILREKMNVRIPSSRPISSYKKGEVISRSPTAIKDMGYDIPQKIKDSLSQPPVVAQAGMMWDFWKLWLGTPQDKLETVTPYLPVNEGTSQIIYDVGKQIEQQPNNEWYTSQNYFTFPGVEPIAFNFPELPNFGDIGKWLLIGGVAIAGIYLLGKAIK